MTQPFYHPPLKTHNILIVENGKTFSLGDTRGRGFSSYSRSWQKRGTFSQQCARKLFWQKSLFVASQKSERWSGHWWSFPDPPPLSLDGSVEVLPARHLAFDGFSDTHTRCFVLSAEWGMPLWMESSSDYSVALISMESFQHLSELYPRGYTSTLFNKVCISAPGRAGLSLGALNQS